MTTVGNTAWPALASLRYPARMVVAAMLLGLLQIVPVGAQQRYVTIGAGATASQGYIAGAAICRLMNRTRKDHGIRCSAVASGNSASTISGIRDGSFEFGVATVNRNDRNLRTVLPLGGTLTLITGRSTPNDMVYELVKVVFTNLLQFKHLYPAFRYNNSRDVLGARMAVPLHDGARRYLEGGR